MTEIIEQLIEFSNDDKYISSESDIALFELTGKLLKTDDLTGQNKDVFNTWYNLHRKNSHYQLSPLEVAQKFRPDDFSKSFSAIKDIFVNEDSGKIKALASGLTFDTDECIRENQVAAGLFILNGTHIEKTSATIMQKKVLAENLNDQIVAENWAESLFADQFSGMVAIDQLVDLEDAIINAFTVLEVNDLDEMEISDAISEKEHPQTLVNRIKGKSEHFTNIHEKYFLAIFSQLQIQLGVDPAEVKAVDKAEAPGDEATNQLMEQMLGQFTDPQQKLFYGDFFNYIQEKGVNQNTKNQQQLANEIGQIEKKWRNTPREALGGLTPDEYKEQHPEVDQSTGKTVKRTEPKVGRNDPCPCGSGKKYKKCHGRNL